MKTYITTIIFFAINLFGFSQEIDTLVTTNGIITIKPIVHSTFVLTYNNTTIFVDPYGNIENFKNLNSPDIILITDIHGDHYSQEVLEKVCSENTIIVSPQSVTALMNENLKSKNNPINNGQSIHRKDIYIEAIPMYNLPETEESKHPKGRGNGYVLTIDNKRIYISGDTADIKEMRTLQNIDIAFVCMNLPYTMDIYQASDAVLDFKPSIVYPFHYRGSNGFSNIDEFKKIVNQKNSSIEVRLRNWYPVN